MSWGIYVLRVIVQGVRDRGVNVLRDKCPGVSVQGVGDQGVLGVSVGGLHVRGGFCPVTRYTRIGSLKLE